MENILISIIAVAFICNTVITIRYHLQANKERMYIMHKLDKEEIG